MTQKRPPVIAVVGHIDHGKSKLQQALRNMDTHMREAGDITQHISAYELAVPYEGVERRATIIDTPGHEAFSHIREHGLGLADLALLVVSSEEGWQKQTTEVYARIQQENIPHIIVFTKIDTEQSDLERAKQSVLREGILLEGLGGDIPWIGISSTTNEGIPALIELMFLTTDVYDIIEDRRDGSIGVLVEAGIDSKVGIVGTVITLAGELTNSGYVRVGGCIAPLRIMKNDRGESVSSITPSTPVRIFGFADVPPVGESVFFHATKKEALEAAKVYVSARHTHAETGDAERTIPIVLRSDTASGLMSIEHALRTVPVQGVHFRIIKRDVGDITEEDVRLALSQHDGQVIGFHTSADQRARALAERSGRTIHLFPTIYELIEWSTMIAERKQSAYEMDNRTGTATVIRVFESQPAQQLHIVGLQIQDGEFRTGQYATVIKNGASAGRFVITSIQQRNQEQDGVSGEKTQFAAQIKGDGAVSLQDTIAGLPNMQVYDETQ